MEPFPASGALIPVAAAQEMPLNHLAVDTWGLAFLAMRDYN